MKWFWIIGAILGLVFLVVYKNRYVWGLMEYQNTSQSNGYQEAERKFNPVKL